MAPSTSHSVLESGWRNGSDSNRGTLPTTTRARDISVKLEGAVSAHDQTSATLTQPRPTLCIRVQTTILLLEGTLPYPVYLPDENVLDWTLENLNQKKYIVVTLFKAMPMRRHDALVRLGLGGIGGNFTREKSWFVVIVSTSLERST